MVSTNRGCVEESKSSVCVCLVALYLYVHVQPVVQIAEPEEMRESQRDVEGVQLFIAQRQLTQDVQIVLVPSAGGQRSLVHHTFTAKQTRSCVLITPDTPVDLLIAGRQVTVNETKRRSVEHEGHAHCSFVS